MIRSWLFYSYKQQQPFYDQTTNTIWLCLTVLYMNSIASQQPCERPTWFWLPYVNEYYTLSTHIQLEYVCIGLFRVTINHQGSTFFLPVEKEIHGRVVCIPFHVMKSAWTTPWHNHDDVIMWKHFPRYWPFVRGIHRSPVNSPHKGQWRGTLMFSLICVWINGWVNNRKAGDLRRYQAHYDVKVMIDFIAGNNL